MPDRADEGITGEDEGISICFIIIVIIWVDIAEWKMAGAFCGWLTGYGIDNFLCKIYTNGANYLAEIFVISFAIRTRMILDRLGTLALVGNPSKKRKTLYSNIMELLGPHYVKRVYTSGRGQLVIQIATKKNTY